jgi:hypothetical protein
MVTVVATSFEDKAPAPSNFNNSFLPATGDQTFTLNYFLVEKSTGEAIFNLLPAYDLLLYHFGNSSCSVDSSFIRVSYCSSGTSIKINEKQTFLFQNLMEALPCYTGGVFWLCNFVKIEVELALHLVPKSNMKKLNSFKLFTLQLLYNQS